MTFEISDNAKLLMLVADKPEAMKEMTQQLNLANMILSSSASFLKKIETLNVIKISISNNVIFEPHVRTALIYFIDKRIPYEDFYEYY